MLWLTLFFVLLLLSFFPSFLQINGVAFQFLHHSHRSAELIPMCLEHMATVGAKQVHEITTFEDAAKETLAVISKVTDPDEVTFVNSLLLVASRQR